MESVAFSSRMGIFFDEFEREFEAVGLEEDAEGEEVFVVVVEW